MTTVALVSDADAPWRKNRPPREPNRIDVCAYCGAAYHPMPRWTHATKPLICVCEYRYDAEANKLQPTDCFDKARADGYTLRGDLTPRR